MTAVDDTEKVREAVVAVVPTSNIHNSKQQQQYSRNSRNIRRFHQQRKEKADEREGRSRRTSTAASRRDRIAPDPEMFLRKDKKHEGEDRRQLQPPSQQQRRRSSKSKRHLQIETSTKALDDLYPDAATSTPRTVTSTPGTSTPGGGVTTRDSTDLRSPGARKSPIASNKIASTLDNDDTPLPDFITQTDRYGNASTPRSAEAVQKARELHPTGAQPKLHVDKNGRLTEHGTAEDLDACTETLMDSFRIMCCCFLSEDDEKKIKKTTTEPEEPGPEDDSVVPRRPNGSLLPKLHPDDHGKKCLVLDLDETLVHSSFRAVPGADFVIPVQIEDVVHFVYVMKRPGVDEFLVEMAKHYEIVLYTASLNKYADPLLDLLDPQRVIRARLFRESCVYYEGNYVKDLSLLNRDLSQAIIVDNSPSSYIFHPENAIDCSSFIDDPADRELDQIAAFLHGVKDAEDVRGLCRKWREWPR